MGHRSGSTSQTFLIKLDQLAPRSRHDRDGMRRGLSAGFRLESLTQSRNSDLLSLYGERCNVTTRYKMPQQIIKIEKFFGLTSKIAQRKFWVFLIVYKHDILTKIYFSSLNIIHCTYHSYFTTF